MRRTGVAVAVVTLVLGSAVQAQARVAGPDDVRAGGAHVVRADAVAGKAPGMLAAMQRDLGLTREQVLRRWSVEERAGRQERALRAALGSAFAGAWVSADGSGLVVATSSARAAGAIRAAGATPKVVSRSLARLQAVQARLDRVVRVPRQVTGWSVDPRRNVVVVSAVPGGKQAAAAFVAAAGVAADVVVEDDGAPGRLTAATNLLGGDFYGIPPEGACSVGFAVKGGFVTAGHCLSTGDPVRTTDQRTQIGTTAGASFPGNDYAWVRTNAAVKPVPWVNTYPDSAVVAGATEAPIGASACSSGGSGGWRCGEITDKNYTFNVDGVTVRGLIGTDHCLEAGDSGGPLLSGLQAQGTAVGSSGCELWFVRDRSFFQPVWEILSTYDLELLTVPSPPPLDCESGNNRFICTMAVDKGPSPTITWSVNGSTVPSWSGQTTVRGGCSASTSVSVRVSYPNGGYSRGPWRGCSADDWP